MENINYQNNFINNQEIQQETVETFVTEQDIVILEIQSMEHENECISKTNWTNEMKVELVIIDLEERKKGREFMSRVEKRWNEEHPMMPMKRQKLRDNAARFKKQSEIMNLVRVKYSTEDDNLITTQLERNTEEEINNLDNNEEYINEQHFTESFINGLFGESILEETFEGFDNEIDICDEDQKLYKCFIDKLSEVSSIDDEQLNSREKIPKLKSKAEVCVQGDRILKAVLGNTVDIVKIIDAVYAMGLAIIESVNGPIRKRKKKNPSGTRKEREKTELIKETRQKIARIANELHRRKIRRKATHKEKRILKEMKLMFEDGRITNNKLKEKKEELLDLLRTQKIILEGMKRRTKRIRNNILYCENQSKLFKDDNIIYEGQTPNIENLRDFWGGIWELEAQTPTKVWMQEIEKELQTKVQQTNNFEISNEHLKKEIMKRKNWSAPGIDGIQNFWWKKFPSIQENLTKIMRVWCERPEEIPKWLASGKTFLIPKTRRLDIPSEYRPITCLNTIYKIFTGLIAGYLKNHVMINEVWDKEQLGARENVLGTIDQLLIDQCIMEEVKTYGRNLAVAYYDYKKAYDFVQHDWFLRILRWISIPQEIIRLITEIMKKWRTKLMVFKNEKLIESRWIQFKRGLLQGDSLSAMAFCISEIPFGILMDNTRGYRMGAPGDRSIKRTHSLFIDDLKLYQENEDVLEMVNDTIVQASYDTGARYGVTKCAEAVFKGGNMIKGKGLNILEEKMKSMDPDNGDYYKFLGLEQSIGIERKFVYNKVAEKVGERMELLVQYELNDKNLMNAINSRVIPVITYGMNIIKFTQNEISSLEMMIKRYLRQNKMHSLQGSDERLYLPRGRCGRGLKSVKDAYEETKIRIACYLYCSEDKWMKRVWERDLEKENISITKEVTKAFSDIGVQLKIEKEIMEIDGIELGKDYKKTNKILKKIYKKGKIKERERSYCKKNMQSEIWKLNGKDNFQWLQTGLNPEKTASIFQMCEQMVETKYWKKLRGLPVEDEKCRLCGRFLENVQHLLAGCEMLAGDEYLKRHNKALSIFAFEVGRKSELILEERNWYKFRWDQNKVLENDKWKILWDFQYHGRKENVNRRPDLTIENKLEKKIWLYDMACPMESNLEKKRNEKLTKYRQIAFEIREKRKDCYVEIVPLIIGCCGGGFKNAMLAVNKTLENEKESYRITRDMQKTVLCESESILRKVLSGLIQS